MPFKGCADPTFFFSCFAYDVCKVLINVGPSSLENENEREQATRDWETAAWETEDEELKTEEFLTVNSILELGMELNGLLSGLWLRTLLL